MKVKSYYAQSIESAMASAAREMGPDAVLITSRKAGADCQHLGAYEVVFGTTADTLDTTRKEQSESSQPPSDSAPSEFELLRNELAEVRRAVRSVFRHANTQHWMPELGEADALMADAEVPAELREEILESVDLRVRDELLYNQARTAVAPGRRPRIRPADSMGNGNQGEILALLLEQFSSLLDVAPVIQPRQAPRAVVALAGPSGSGKTTTLVKLAIQYGLAARQPVQILSTDYYRAGATEQLRVYSAAIGVGFQVADTPLALGQMLEEHRNKKLILIDTSGAAPADMDAQTSFAAYLAQHPEVETHLVLPVTAGSSALKFAVKQFACFKPRKAILTKLDESSTHGGALGHAIIAGLPISFVTNGQHVPNDLAPADKDKLLGFLAGTATKRAVVSAA